jgi:hypothetical protein
LTTVANVLARDGTFPHRAGFLMLHWSSPAASAPNGDRRGRWRYRPDVRGNDSSNHRAGVGGRWHRIAFVTDLAVNSRQAGEPVDLVPAVLVGAVLVSVATRRHTLTAGDVA